MNANGAAAGVGRAPAPCWSLGCCGCWRSLAGVGDRISRTIRRDGDRGAGRCTLLRAIARDFLQEFLQSSSPAAAAAPLQSNEKSSVMETNGNRATLAATPPHPPRWPSPRPGCGPGGPGGPGGALQAPSQRGASANSGAGQRGATQRGTRSRQAERHARPREPSQPRRSPSRAPAPAVPLLQTPLCGACARLPGHCQGPGPGPGSARRDGSARGKRDG